MRESDECNHAYNYREFPGMLGVGTWSDRKNCPWQLQPRRTNTIAASICVVDAAITAADTDALLTSSDHMGTDTPP